jgi:chemotaxis protein methyltransferase CheR
MEIITENNRDRHTWNEMSAMLSENDFQRLSELIQSSCGIKMPNPKKIMLEARLRKRLKALGMKSFRAYCDYLFSTEGRKQELVPMIDVITTNKTDFFREPRHFDYLTQTAVPELGRSDGAGIRRQLVVWSAGCSTGEEPYTIAMVLNEYTKNQPAFHFMVLATDISTKVLDKAMRGIYGQERIEAVPGALKKQYFMQSRDPKKYLVRIVPELRAAVRFRRLNFMDGDFGMREPMDIIFCRNVIIYFDKPTQERLLKRLCEHLIPGGYIFMGHSETLSGLNVPLVSVGSMVYRKHL